MANGNGGDGMIKVVELFVDNINESTKTMTQGELSEDIADIDKKLDTAISEMSELKTSIKLMINTVRVSVAILTIAALLSTAVMYFGNRSLIKQLNSQQNIELNSDIKGKGVINEKVSR